MVEELSPHCPTASWTPCYSMVLPQVVKDRAEKGCVRVKTLTLLENYAPFPQGKGHMQITW